MASRYVRVPDFSPITKEVQLLVEGNDQRNFFEAFVDHLSLTNVQIQNFGGVTELRGFLLALANDDAFQEIVRSVGIVRDAEESAAGAFQSVQDSLRNADLPAPVGIQETANQGGGLVTTVLILPDGKREGMLETLLCETFGDTPIDDCIDAFFECVEGSHKPIKRPDKARARVFLTTQPEPHFSVGVATKKGYWDLNHEALKNVREFLRKIAEGQNHTVARVTNR